MSRFIDDLLVGLVLLASVGYAVYSLGPKRVRATLLLGMSSLLGRLPRFAGVQGIAERLGRAADSKAKGSCGGCDSCGSEKPAAQGSSKDIRIPLSKIGKRP